MKRARKLAKTSPLSLWANQFVLNFNTTSRFKRSSEPKYASSKWDYQSKRWTRASEKPSKDAWNRFETNGRSRKPNSERRTRKLHRNMPRTRPSGKPTTTTSSKDTTPFPRNMLPYSKRTAMKKQNYWKRSASSSAISTRNVNSSRYRSGNVKASTRVPCLNSKSWKSNLTKTPRIVFWHLCIKIWHWTRRLPTSPIHSRTLREDIMNLAHASRD